MWGASWNARARSHRERQDRQACSIVEERTQGGEESASKGAAWRLSLCDILHILLLLLLGSTIMAEGDDDTGAFWGWQSGSGKDWPTLGFIGCGTIASATVEGLCGGERPPCKIIVSPRSRAKSAALKEKYPQIVSVGESNQDVVDGAEVIFVAVLPGLISEVLAQLKFRETQLVISMVATVDFDAIAPLVAPVPACAIVRVCPLPAVAERRGVTTIAPKHPLVKDIFDYLGGAVQCSDGGRDEQLNAHRLRHGAFYELTRTWAEWLLSTVSTRPLQQSILPR